MSGIILLVINYIRSRRRSTPRVLLVLDEATNANLIDGAGYEVRALAELQKKGLNVHVLVQGLSCQLRPCVDLSAALIAAVWCGKSQPLDYFSRRTISASS